MKKYLFLAGLAILVLTGCTRRYAITLTNTDTIIATTRPKLERGFYLFKDSAGRDVRISELKVRQIEAK